MTELKATTVYDAYWTANSTGQGTGVQVYPKSEVDKVIANLKKQSSCTFSDDCLRVRHLESKLDTLLRCLKDLVMQDLIKDCPSKKTATEIVQECENDNV